MCILVTCLSRTIYWFFWRKISCQDSMLRDWLVTQVLCDTTLSRHLVLSLWLSESWILSPLVTVIFTSCKWSPLFSGCGHPLLRLNSLFVSSFLHNTSIIPPHYLLSSHPTFSFGWLLNTGSTVVLIVDYSCLSYKPYLLLQIKSRLAHAWQAINKIPHSEGTPLLLYFFPNTFHLSLVLYMKPLSS